MRAGNDEWPTADAWTELLDVIGSQLAGAVRDFREIDAQRCLSDEGRLALLNALLEFVDAAGGVIVLPKSASPRAIELLIQALRYGDR